MNSKFKLFNELIVASGVRLQKGDQILALENEDLEKLYEIFGTNHEQFKTFPKLKQIIENHIVDRIHTNTIQMVSGVSFSYVPNKSVDNIELHKAYDISGMIYIPFDGILLTKNDEEAIKNFSQKNLKKTRETSFVGNRVFREAQFRYLAERHSEHCAVIDKSNREYNEAEVEWYSTDQSALKLTEIPRNLPNFSDRRLLNINILNILLQWLVDLMIDARYKKKLLIPSLEDWEIDNKIWNKLQYTIQDVVEILFYKPFPLKDLQLYGVASFAYHFSFLDFEYLSYMTDGSYTVKQTKSAYNRFAQFKISHNQEFQNDEFRYSATRTYLKFLPSFEIDFADCLKSGSRFILFALNIIRTNIDKGGYGNHANMLIYDKKYNTVERFESVGKEGTWYQQDLLDQALSKYFKTKYNMEYISPLDWCPVNIQGDQEAESEKGKVKGNTKNFCQAWSFWYADLRLSNPGLTRDQVIDLGIKTLKENPETLTEYIIDYSKKFEKYL